MTDLVKRQCTGCPRIFYAKPTNRSDTCSVCATVLYAEKVRARPSSDDAVYTPRFDGILHFDKLG